MGMHMEINRRPHVYAW